MAGYLCLMPLASAPVCVYRLFCCPCSPMAVPWADGHCRCAGTLHPDFKFGWTGFCQIIFEFWPQIKGIRTNERVTRSKKRRFLRFFVMYWLINGYTDANLLSNGLQNPNLRELRFRRAKGKVSSCERWCFIARNISFERPKGYVWHNESYAFAKWRMMNEGWRSGFYKF